MIRIARLRQEEREALFYGTGDKLGIVPSIIEKDFWVCYMLDFLFHRSLWPEAFVFKGGTSLSKAYHAISRFSEDIDLILDWRLIGYSDEAAWKDRSRSKQDQFGKTMVKAASAFLEESFVPAMQEGLTKELGYSVDVKMDEADKDRCTVNFYYDQAFPDTYLRPEIRLEIGPLADWTPSHECRISPFAAEQYPDLFIHPSTNIRTVDAERTFWEKILILHKTAYSCEEKGFPSRYARHYYDVFCLYKTGIGKNALENKNLLLRDALFKQKFYYAKSARYDLATQGSIKLIPRSQEALEKLSEDYEHMKEMIYGSVPDLHEILRVLQKIEDRINGSV